MAYVSIQEVRDEGLKDESRYPDALITSRIKMAQQLIEQRTRQWFEPRALTLLLDGNDGQHLFLRVPIIALTALYANGESTPLDPSRYVVHNSITEPDDRRNPRVSLVVDQDRSIFTDTWVKQQSRFKKGRQNQRLVGTFGFVEPGAPDAQGAPTWEPPALIKRACLKLVMRNIKPLAPGGQPATAGGMVFSQSVDGHSITYALPTSMGLKPGTVGITGDTEVEQILGMYKAPIILGAPGSTTIVAG